MPPTPPSEVRLGGRPGIEFLGALALVLKGWLSEHGAIRRACRQATEPVCR